MQEMTIVRADMLGGIFEREGGLARCSEMFESLSDIVKRRTETRDLTLSLQKFIMKSQEFFPGGLLRYIIYLRDHTEIDRPIYTSIQADFPT